MKLILFIYCYKRGFKYAAMADGNQKKKKKKKKNGQYFPCSLILILNSKVLQSKRGFAEHWRCILFSLTIVSLHLWFRIFFNEQISPLYLVGVLVIISGRSPGTFNLICLLI